MSRMIASEHPAMNLGIPLRLIGKQRASSAPKKTVKHWKVVFTKWILISFGQYTFLLFKAETCTNL